MMSKNKIEEKEEVGMEFLNVEDFKWRNFDGLSPLDILVEVCAVARQKFKQEELVKEAKNSNKKATENIGREEELMGIKQGRMYGPSSTSKGGGAANLNSPPAPDFVKLGLMGFSMGAHHHEAYPVLSYKQQMKYHQNVMEPTRSSSSSSEQKSTELNSAATTDGHGEAHTRSSASINGLKLKRKLDYDHDHKDGTPKKQIKNKNKNLPSGNSTMIDLNLPPSDQLPKEYMDKIRSLGGIRLETLELVFWKKLYSSDTLKSQNRLTMPPAQIKSQNFLKAKEIADLKRNDTLTEIPLIDPRLKIKKVSLGRWNLSDKKYNYVLKTTWNEIVKENELGKHDVIQVWWFRNNEEKIHLALVLVKRADPEEEEGEYGAKEADDREY